jgi:surface carbohydrate biosynthesis protein (TIGR04326 family)
VFADRLRSEYAPYDRFETGPALRFAHLFQESAAAESRGADVLVVVPGFVNEATELLTKLAEAMRDPIPASVLIKPHPALPMPRLRELVPEIDDIPRLAVVSGSMGDALARAAVAVTLASSAIVDTIAAGVPVCRVRRDTDLDMDPALWLDVPADVCPAASTAEELRAALLDCVAMPPERRARLTAFARRFRKHALGAIENEAFAGFVRDTKNRDGEPRRATALKAG